jgi:hypothetical protein
MTSPLEAVWFFAALLSTLLSIRMLCISLSDRALLKRLGINSVKLLLVGTNIRTQAIRVIVSTGLLFQSIFALALVGTGDLWFPIHSSSVPYAITAYAVLLVVSISVCIGALMDARDREKALDEEIKSHDH